MPYATGCIIVFPSAGKTPAKQRREPASQKKENGKMKMSKRAEQVILNTYGNRGLEMPVLCGLVVFAAQNSGLDLANYATPGDQRPGAWREGYKNYRTEARSINQDWQRFKAALAIAGAEGVTDNDIIEAAPRSFSGRLEWISKDYLRENHGMNTDYTPRWSYTAGQYFPTEYRKAAATILETAIRAVRQARPAQTRAVESIAQLKALNEANGGCWFGRGEMRFFGTRIESGIVRGHFFVTSEQPPHGSRKFSVRSFDDKGDVDTVGEFCTYSSKADALAAIPQN